MLSGLTLCTLTTLQRRTLVQWGGGPHVALKLITLSPENCYFSAMSKLPTFNRYFAVELQTLAPQSRAYCSEPLPSSTRVGKYTKLQYPTLYSASNLFPFFYDYCNLSESYCSLSGSRGTRSLTDRGGTYFLHCKACCWQKAGNQLQPWPYNYS